MKDFTIITIKADPGLKLAAQTKADELGITISQVLNQALRDFLGEGDYTFRPPSSAVADMVEEARVKYRRQSQGKEDSDTK